MKGILKPQEDLDGGSRGTTKRGGRGLVRVLYKKKKQLVLQKVGGRS